MLRSRTLPEGKPMAVVIGLLALLMLLSTVEKARPFCQKQQTVDSEQVPVQNSQRGNAVATILQSGSTNTRGYRVTIFDDGSATAVISTAPNSLRSSQPHIQQFPAGTTDADRLQALLTRIGDVSTIPTGRCAKSVSFGTRTQISYKGKTSGDIQCIRGAASGEESLLRASEELSILVQDTLRHLNVRNSRVATTPRP